MTDEQKEHQIQQLGSVGNVRRDMFDTLVAYDDEIGQPVSPMSGSEVWFTMLGPRAFTSQNGEEVMRYLRFSESRLMVHRAAVQFALQYGLTLSKTVPTTMTDQRESILANFRRRNEKFFQHFVVKEESYCDWTVPVDLLCLAFIDAGILKLGLTCKEELARMGSQCVAVMSYLPLV
ncbi:hypothetical protein BJ508DRAFT_338872 [Ascobolus immersus RN42]|uniref:Uncharacterized protein n=1 Tax=Ascobolus immersus RN42 TaxID=1160509 RepID=A0A3N4ILB7_ASCIM|nr:hypothetical protein BJ508DRAFT_338872 [Ascobolus immersus RN42]